MIRTISFSIIALLIIAIAISCSTESTPTYTLTTTANPTEGGTITPNAGTFEEGEAVSLQAIPSEGWVFSRWEQDVTETANPIDINMNQNYAVVAVFTVWPRDTTTEIVDVYNPATGKTWMDRNLGASRSATSSTDAEAYGDLYQWGRAADGHEKRISDITSVMSSTDLPGHGNFINVSDSPGDWRSPQNDNLWQGVNGTNNPCPEGYRLPTVAEWETELQSWSSSDAAGAFASPLKLPAAGYRHSSSGTLTPVGSFGNYWSSTGNSTNDGNGSRKLNFNSSNAIASIAGYARALGYSVRCIKD